MPKRIDRSKAVDLDSFLKRFRYCVAKGGGAREIEAKTDIPESTIRTYIERKKEPPRDVLLAVAQKAQVNPAWLLTGTGHPGLPFMSELEADSPAAAIIDCAAKAYGVPREVARARLEGSLELSALEIALRQPDDMIQVYEAITNIRWGQFQRRTLAAILGFNVSFLPLVARCKNFTAFGLKEGDWAVIDPTAPLACGLLCVEGRAMTPVIVSATLSAGLKPIIQLYAPADQIDGPDRFRTLEELASCTKVIGRVMGVVRFEKKTTVE